MHRLLSAFLLAAVVAPTEVWAFPEDIVTKRLLGLEEARRQARFDWVVRDMAMALSPAPHHSTGALGLYEFEVSTTQRMSFRHTRPQGTDAQSAWDDLVDDGEASPIGWTPGLSFRKGLPFSLEVGGHFDWVGGSRQFLAGGYGRWVVQDGWDKIPDISVQLGYTGLIGNDQLRLGVFELDLGIGYTFVPKGAKGSLRTRVSPYAGYGYLMSHASTAMAEIPGVQRVTGWAKDALPGTDARQFRFHRVFLGFELWAGQVVFHAGGDITIARAAPATGSLQLGLGLRI